MRILHLITSMNVGGAQVLRCELLKSFIETGQSKDIHHVAYFRDGPSRMMIEGIGVETSNVGGFFVSCSPLVVARVVWLIRRFKPDIIHSALWLANIVARIAGWWCKIPVICDLHSMPEHCGQLRNFLDRLPFPLPSRFVAVGHEVSDAFKNELASRMLIKSYRSEAGRRTVVIENGVDEGVFRYSSVDRLNLRQDFGISQKAFVVGAVGRLVSVKRYDILLKAFVQFRSKCIESGCELVCVIVGDGALKNNLYELSRSLEVEKYVVFAGYRADARRFYSMFDCLAISSQTEGLSLALLEAQASGLPVVTTGVNGYHELVVSGENGFVVEPGDAVLISVALRKVLGSWKGDAENRLSLLKEKNTLDTMVLRYSRLYENVFSG